VRKAFSVVGPLFVHQLENALGRFLEEAVFRGLMLVILDRGVERGDALPCSMRPDCVDELDPRR
jgi:hypothetical protein